MDKLLEALAEKGVDASEMDDEQVRKVAKAVGLDPVDYLPRVVEVNKSYTNKRNETNMFISSSPFVIGRKPNGTAQTVKGLFLRQEVLDQAIDDLTTARGLLAAQAAQDDED